LLPSFKVPSIHAILDMIIILLDAYTRSLWS
jgi:hypothetical protein